IGPEAVFRVVAGAETVGILVIDEAVAVVVDQVAALVELVASAEHLFGGRGEHPGAHARAPLSVAACGGRRATRPARATVRRARGRAGSGAGARGRDRVGLAAAAP